MPEVQGGRSKVVISVGLDAQLVREVDRRCKAVDASRSEWIERKVQHAVAFDDSASKLNRLARMIVKDADQGLDQPEWQELVDLARECVRARR